jgi:DNA-binding CsgD family transcriptional regulator
VSASVDSSLRSGEEALRHAAWGEARAAFETALAEGETVEALEGLGIAARWQMDGAAALDAHERAYRLARESGDEVASARLAIELAFDCGQFRGSAETGGWLERAGHLLDRLPPQPEHAVLAYWRANLALNAEHDPAEARRLAADGVEAARSTGSVDYEMVCRALEGLALVADGNVREGMRGLDEAVLAAVAGEVENVRVAEVICCHLIDACQRVRDLERAEEWCQRVEEIAERYGDTEMFATCRTHYADLLVWRGDWGEAEQTLEAACRDLGGVPRKVVEGVVRLAELRRRQGRLDQSEALLAQAEGHRLALLVRAALDLDRGDARGAADEADRYLRRVGKTDRFERVPGLELSVQALVELGDTPAARRALDELDETSALVDTTLLRATALLARGRVEAAAAPETARASLEDAVDLFSECGARYEAAQALLALARVLQALGRAADAASSESTARATLTGLGAPVPAPVAEPSPLTAREREVLRLVARGRSNDAIAAELVLSVRTVERHVENIYEKLGLSGRTARAAATAWAHTHGVV